MPPSELVTPPEGPQPRLTVSAVAARLGVAPATLRTWARRYDLGPSEHAPGAHRRYTPADLARLDQMRRLTLDGVAPADAAAVVLAGTDTGVAPVSLLPLATAAEPPATDTATAEVGTAAPKARTAGGPGGRMLAIPGSGPGVRGLARAAMTLDSDAVMRSLRRSLATVGVVATWDDLLCPVLVAAGSRWASTGHGVEIEHLLSECTASAMREVVLAAPSPVSVRPVLLASAADDQHTLPLHALAAALAERRVAARFLGPALPMVALHSAVRRTGPSALFVWSYLSATADVEALDTLPVTRPHTALFVGGPGWARLELPPRITRCADFSDALDALSDAAGIPAT